MLNHTKSRSRRLTMPGVMEGIRRHGLRRFADTIGVRIQTLYTWQRSGVVPVERVPDVSANSGVPCHVIRPDLPKIFPPPSINNAA